jgi:hypothetical protein
MSPFTPKDWRNAAAHDGGGDTSTPLSAVALEDLETRVGNFGVSGWHVPSASYPADDTGAVACTDSINAALVAADAAGGGVVTLGPGEYLQDDTITIPASCHLRGLGGAAGTRLFWTVEMADEYGIVFISPETTNTAHWPSLIGFEIDGPGDEGVDFGDPPSTQHGVYMESKAQVKDCFVHGFYGGLNIVNDNAVIENCWCKENYFGIYKIVGDGQGNARMTNVLMNGNKRAGIGIHGDAVLTDSRLISCGMGNQPYGIYKENNGSYSAGAVSLCTLIDCGFEAMGNALFYDQGQDKEWNSITWVGGQTPNMNAANKVVGESTDYVWVADHVHDVFMYGPGLNLPVGDVGVLNWNTFQNIEIRDGKTLIGDLQSTSKRLLPDACTAEGDFWIYNEVGAKCRVMKLADGAVPRYDVLYLGQGANVNGATPSGSDIPVGVAQTDIDQNQWGVVAVHGRTSVNFSTGGTSNEFWALADLASRGDVKQQTTPPAGSDMYLVMGYVTDNGTIYLKGL